MSPPNPETAETALNARELLGLLSARLIHSLSNDLLVVSGSLSAAARLEGDPGRRQENLQSAQQAADHAGALLEQLANCRRHLHDDLGRTEAETLPGILQGWVERHRDWKLELAENWRARPGEGLPLSPTMLLFVLDSVVRETRSRDGIARLSRSTAGTFSPRNQLAEAAAGGIQISLTYPAERPLDWAGARNQFDRMHLAAAYEILAQVRARPTSHTIISGLQDTTFVVAFE